MALVNRDKDVSEQKDVVRMAWTSQFSTGATLVIGEVPYPCTVQSAEAGCLGISGAPQLILRALRSTSGGMTSIILGISNMIIANLGLSGPLGYSGLAVPGSTLLSLQAKDVLIAEMAVANTAATQGVVEVVLKKTQDIVSYNGISG